MSIRLRLALWCTAVIGVTLVVFSLLLYSLMEQHLFEVADESIASRAHHIAGTIRVEADQTSNHQHVELPPIDTFESPGIYVQVIQTDETVVAQSDNLNGQQIPVDRQAISTALDGKATFYTTSVGSEELRTYVQPLTLDNNVIGFVQVGRSYGDTYALLERLRWGLFGAGSVSLLLAGVIAWAIAGSVLKPVATMAQTARAIALSRGFSRRLENASSRDELGQLARTFNEMLESLAEAYGTQQRFIADASHELRAPLTAVRANLELLAKQRKRLPDGEQQALAQAATDEAERMARLVTDLLSLARADAGQKVQTRPTELDRLLMEVHASARLLTEDVRVGIKEIDEVSLSADPDLIKQLLLILVDNAIRYTPAGGKVELSLSREGGTASLKVSDTGIGIAEGDLPHIFERFYRADRARAREKAGTGLGLAIAKWITEQHGGEITVESAVGEGTTFTVRLPLASMHRTNGA